MITLDSTEVIPKRSQFESRHMPRRTLISFLLAFVCLASNVAFAEIYKCKNLTTGKVALGDKPCEFDQKSEVLRPSSSNVMNSTMAESKNSQTTDMMEQRPSEQTGNAVGANFGQNRSESNRENSIQCQNTKRELRMQKAEGGAPLQSYEERVDRACSNTVVAVDKSDTEECHTVERELRIEEKKSAKENKNVEPYRKKVKLACARK